MAIANLVEPEYQKKINKRIQSRLHAAHLRGCPQELSNCVDSAEREYILQGSSKNGSQERRLGNRYATAECSGYLQSREKLTLSRLTLTPEGQTEGVIQG